MLPESVGDLGLQDTIGGKVCIFPASRAVAYELCPVAIPRGSAVVALGCVVISLSMASHKEHFVYDISGSFAVQVVDLKSEFLPLGELRLLCRGKVLGGRVGAVDEAEVV